MANYERTFKSTIWDEKWFEELTSDEFRLYVLLHTGAETSDTSVFPISVNRMAYHCNTTRERIEEILQKFTDMDLISYDCDTGEILVKDYFFHNPPRGGIRYKGYAKDFDKIKSHALIEEAAEIAKNYPITIAFFAALADHIDIKEENYKIKKTKETAESTKTVTQRGLDAIAANRAAVDCEEFRDDLDDLPF